MRLNSRLHSMHCWNGFMMYLAFVSVGFFLGLFCPCPTSMTSQCQIVKSIRENKHTKNKEKSCRKPTKRLPTFHIPLISSKVKPKQKQKNNSLITKNRPQNRPAPISTQSQSKGTSREGWGPQAAKHQPAPRLGDKPPISGCHRFAPRSHSHPLGLRYVGLTPGPNP